jgi:hypothetical protein
MTLALAEKKDALSKAMYELAEKECGRQEGAAKCPCNRALLASD